MVQAVKYTTSDISKVLTDRPMVPVEQLPMIWQSLSKMRGVTNLSDRARADYVEMAQYLACGASAGRLEALTQLAQDFDRDRYPDFDALKAQHTGLYAQRMLAATATLFDTFGYDMPASFYQLLVHLAVHGEINSGITMFRDEATMQRDTLWDAVMHSALLISPIGLYMQSVLSQHKLMFVHIVMCSCVTVETPDLPFSIKWSKDLQPAYLQNMMAAIIKQYEI